jgi:hypothetical protein
MAGKAEVEVEVAALLQEGKVYSLDTVVVADKAVLPRMAVSGCLGETLRAGGGGGGGGGVETRVSRRPKLAPAVRGEEGRSRQRRRLRRYRP